MGRLGSETKRKKIRAFYFVNLTGNLSHSLLPKWRRGRIKGIYLSIYPSLRAGACADHEQLALHDLTFAWRFGVLSGGKLVPVCGGARRPESPSSVCS